VQVVNRYQKIVLVIIGIVSLIVPMGCTCSNGMVAVDCYGDLIPCDTGVYDIGSAVKSWANEWVGFLWLTDQCWDDLSIAMANAKVPAANAPTWRDYKQSQVPAFSATQVNVLYFSAQLPHSYKEGSNLEFHIHVAYPDAVAGNSVWYFSYSWANDGVAFPVASSTTVTKSSIGIVDGHQRMQIVANIDGTGKKISSVLLCSIQRLGNSGDDNYGNEIYLVSGDFHYQVDSLGSRLITTK
jgi:hypothetical protein